MDHTFIWKGIALGFAIAAPVGPIGVLCIKRTLQYGRLSGLCSGLGAAVADTAYGAVAAFGLTLVSDFLLEMGFYLRMIGGIFLIYLGMRTFFSRPMETDSSVSHRTLFADFLSTFFLTLTNPMTIISYVAIFAGLGIADVYDPTDATALVCGILLGSTLWWLLLSEGITLFRKKVSSSLMITINRAAGILITLFGLIALLTCI